MADSGSLLLSVRADARQMVAPDYLEVDVMIGHTAESRAEAVQLVAMTEDRLTTDLGALGGIPFDQGAQRHPLTWLAHSSSIYEERYHDKETGRAELTGQVSASLAVRIAARELHTLDSLTAVLVAHQGVNVHSVSWHVDWDNPAWPQVRGTAIKAAIRKARDYAAALGATVLQIEHVADAGLLGGSNASYDSRKVVWSARAASRGGPETPALNPAPIELIATIDARVRCTEASVRD
jgi:uncharacterized protein